MAVDTAVDGDVDTVSNACAVFGTDSKVAAMDLYRCRVAVKAVDHAVVSVERTVVDDDVAAECADEVGLANVFTAVDGQRAGKRGCSADSKIARHKLTTVTVDGEVCLDYDTVIIKVRQGHGITIEV